MAASTKATKSHDIRRRLLKETGQVNRPGDFCTSGSRPVTMPGLEVDGIGTIGLPLTKTQARELIKHSRQAPYGKGTETVVDTDVRRVWELDPERFQLTNPEWDAFIDSLLVDVKQELGLAERKLSAHLYKLLVYEKGSFFLPHRDGEKLDGMVATLVIGLPAVHEGGELIISHDGRTATIELTGAASGRELSYAAFYADCEHEIRPVRSGYRLCLAYNLTLEKGLRGKRIGAPSFGAAAASLASELSGWRRADGPQKLAVLLEHRYTQDGLTVDRLKGVDRSRAEVLFEAAEEAGCIAHLALITLWQSGSAEGGYDPYDWRHRRRSRWYDEDDGDEDSAGEYEMGEIYDWSLSADHWSDRDGRKVALGEIGFDESEIVAETPLEEGEPSREDFEGYTGNAGMTLERWYHRAAVVIWPRERHFDVLCEAGTDASIGGLQVMAGKFKRAAKSRREELRHEYLRFATAIIDSWEAGPRSRWSAATQERIEPIDRNIFPALLCELDAADLLRKFLSQVMVRDGEVQLDKTFITFCKQHGWELFEPELVEIVQTATRETIPRNVQLVQMLCVQRDRNAGRLQLCARLCEQAVRALIDFDQSDQDDNWYARELDRAEILASLVKAMLAADAEEPLSRLIDHTLAAADKYDLTDAHLTAMFKLESSLKRSPPNPTVTRWLDACRDELAGRTESPPQPPSDFRRDVRISCNCKDCRVVREFLADPDREQLRLPLAKERRQHLHQEIDRHRCDLTHVTERRGRPYTLVCTKTTASYEEKCRIHDRDLKNLKRLRELMTAMKRRA